MKEYLIYMVLILFSIQLINSQEDGVVSLDIPIRNSLKFNRYLLDPTFSFVREQNMYLSFYNKREWVQFEDAPQTFLASYSGRFRENSGLGIGLFQQNYGVLTTFGGVLNFAYNVTLDRESNLTFGLNLGVYKSGLNDGKVITNYPDPSLDNIPSNTLLTINPGINYGTRFFDFGLSVNNVVLYNLKSSQMVEDDPQQGVQAHVMYTGYMESSGFFDQAKFSGLLRSEFNKDNTILSGIAMVTVPKGIWAQAGYNSLYGMSVGIVLNISEQISIEYNYEKGMGNLSNFGSSH
jgi:type IX secretion system PorP/SprF family membrane protein